MELEHDHQDEAPVEKVKTEGFDIDPKKELTGKDYFFNPVSVILDQGGSTKALVVVAQVLLMTSYELEQLADYVNELNK